MIGIFPGELQPVGIGIRSERQHPAIAAPIASPPRPQKGSRIVRPVDAIISPFCRAISFGDAEYRPSSSKNGNQVLTPRWRLRDLAFLRGGASVLLVEHLHQQIACFSIWWPSR